MYFHSARYHIHYERKDSMKKSNHFFQKLFACLLAIMMLCSLIPETSWADEDTTDADSFVATSSAILTTGYGNTKQLKIESYLTSATETTTTIKPCDIIFVMDQSKWMNTSDDEGNQRATIIAAMKDLLDTLAAPTTGGEHRVAIAGYGRLNLGGQIDPYDRNTYPGQVSTSSNVSFNTGYYTKDGFVSKSGWTEVRDFSTADLPKLPAGYLSGESYDRVFLSLEEAENVLDPDTMMAWYAGASRMDAGLTIAEQLADIANANDTNEERNLIVCIMASSLPIQNTPQTGKSVIREQAVLTASEKLKAQGATIFAFGDYHSSGRSDIDDTEENFVNIMEKVCTSADYFHPLGDYTNVTEALNQLITQITITSAGEANESYTITADTFTVSGIDNLPEELVTEQDGVKTITWGDIISYYGDQAEKLIQSTMTKVSFYNFTGYDESGTPTFERSPRVSFEVPLSDMTGSNGQLTYDTTMIPIPANVTASSPADSDQERGDALQYYGYKVVITVASPITVTYEWAESGAAYAPPKINIPASETMASGTTHAAPTVHGNNEHYVFEGWYLDAACTAQYTSDTIPLTSFTLYGKWSRYVLIEYYWDIWDGAYVYPDSSARVIAYGVPDVYIPEGAPGYMFAGWYLDPEYTEAFTPKSLDVDIELYAKWIPNADTKYTIQFYQQNASEDGYTEVTTDRLTLTGKTAEDIAPITKVYHGYTMSKVTYENSVTAAQTEALPISGDGSLIVKVYYDCNPQALPVNPLTAAYRVEHYREELDGSYTLIETEMPLYGTLDTTVSAVPKTLEHYHVNTEKSVLSGNVIMPTVTDGEISLLTLQVYYDLDSVTISYDLNGGSDTGKVDYSSASVKYGVEATIKAAPSMDGYTFTGWQAENKTYSAGQQITMTKDITLVAGWEKISEAVPDTKPAENTGTVEPGTSGLSQKEKESSTTPDPGSQVETGDTGNMTLWLILLSVSAAGMVGVWAT